MYGGIARRGRATATTLQRLFPQFTYGEKEFNGARGVRRTAGDHGHDSRTRAPAAPEGTREPSPQV
eukprot:844158-Prorocentrum_minimum.AAC.5